MRRDRALLWRFKFLVYSHTDVGLGISRTNADFQWNPVTEHFIKFVSVETNKLVGRNPTVMHVRETYGQRSSMAVGSKQRALAISFSRDLNIYSQHQNVARVRFHSMTASVCQQEPREAEVSQRGSDRTYLRWQVQTPCARCQKRPCICCS